MTSLLLNLHHARLQTELQEEGLVPSLFVESLGGQVRTWSDFPADSVAH